jgi:hypothetical protein
MRLAKAALVVLALLAVAGGYLQERKRLEEIRRLPVAEARALYESAQARRERVMRVVTALLVAAAVAAVAARLGA